MRVDTERIILIFFLISLILLFIYIYKSNPYNGPIINCAFNKITGLKCPGCGMTRALNLIMHFKFKEALYYNALSIFLIFWLILYFVFNTFGINKNFLYIILVLISILYGIIRNI